MKLLRFYRLYRSYGYSRAISFYLAAQRVCHA